MVSSIFLSYLFFCISWLNLLSGTSWIISTSFSHLVVAYRSSLCPPLQYVPMDVLRDHNIALPKRVLFRDIYERLWPGRVVMWKDGRKWIGGWRAFCKWNHVSERDSLICEFVEENGHRGYLIVVHIHRA